MVARSLCLAAIALTLAAAFPTSDTVVPEQELSQHVDIDYDSIYDSEDDSTIEQDEKHNDEQDGIISKEGNDMGGQETSKDADEIHAEVKRAEKKDAEDDAKWDALEKVKPTKMETLKSMVSAFGKKEKDPVSGKTYWEEEEELKAEEKKIQAKKAAAILARDKKRDAETKAAEVKYNDMWSHAFAQNQKELEDHLKNRVKVATSDFRKAK